MQPIQCASCKHYNKDLKCDAFPSGIPDEILTGVVDHNNPYPGDHNIRFELQESQ